MLFNSNDYQAVVIAAFIPVFWILFSLPFLFGLVPEAIKRNKKNKVIIAIGAITTFIISAVISPFFYGNINPILSETLHIIVAVSTSIICVAIPLMAIIVTTCILLHKKNRI